MTATEMPLTKNIRPGEAPPDMKAYEKAGGYQGARKALSGMSPQEVTEVVKASGLKGRGGAGFPTGVKWSFVPLGEDAPWPHYIIANADEMEPGTFKDRLLMEGDPHLLVEGMIISAYALQAEYGYIFLRWAYKKSERRLRAAIEEAYAKGYLGKDIFGSGFNFELHLHTSAGRYMCGEETGLLNSLEGRRAMPRAKPPYPQTSGLWGKPTIVNNVETLCCLPSIMTNGSQWFRDLSLTGDGGTKIYGVSGRVVNPGAWELPLGITLRELIFEHAGGMREGYQFRGAVPGGASTEFLVEDHLDINLDFNSVQEAGSRLGTGTAIVLDYRTCPVGLLANMEHFFAQESCGWCTPCREGLSWAAKILKALDAGAGRPGDLERLEALGKNVGPGKTFCALAPGAAAPLLSALNYFRADFQRHIDEQGCPWR